MLLMKYNGVTKSLRRKWAGNVARMGWKRNEYIVLVTREGKRPLGNSWRR
jgi:hypothetical protein